TDAYNNIIVCGVFTDPTISFGNFTLSNAGISSSSDIFIVKYDSNGNVIWAKSAGGSNYEFVRSITVDDSGDLIISGQFKSQSIFSVPNMLINSYAGYFDIFIAKYSSSGNLIWTESTGSNNDDFSGCTTLDNNENILITGAFRSQNILFGSDTLYNFGNDDMFIAKLSNSNVYTVNQIACGYFNSPSGNYTWINSGSYLDTITNISGIDSIILVNLIINPINTSISTVSACNSFFWINGQTYTTSNNSATFTYNLISGCDSIVTLNLTINNSSYTTDYIVACNSYTWIDGITYTTSNNSATYTLSNISGCDSVIALNLTIHNLDTSITQNGTELTATDISANYQWLDCNNSYAVLINDTNQSFTPLISGSYAVYLTSNGCVDTSGCFNLIVVGNDHLSAEKDYLKIAPNPSNGNINIEFPVQEISGMLYVYDVNGKLVYSEYVSPYTYIKNINLQGKLSSGMYALSMVFGEERFLGKMVVN
ncbi:MAG: T9SS type A sorting domain-containing protein, partial [Bacteroidota bacterium]